MADVLVSRKEVLEMQCNLLISDFKDPKTIALVKETIRGTSNGFCLHRAGALQLGFEKAFELRKKKRQPPGVKLRCTSWHCSWRDNPISYSSVGLNICCPGCSYYMQCADCGYKRGGEYSSCQGCGRRFE